MKRAHKICTVIVLALLVAQLHSAEPTRVGGVPLKKARICVTGYDHNRPDPFPGLGDFIGWVGDVVRLANGELLYVHSAGYWHVSFATPVLLRKNLVKPYTKAGFDLKHKAPTGGRIMACRSRDNGQTWSKPVTVYDGPRDSAPSATCVTKKGTVIQVINMQASWYGFPDAPKGRQKLNTRQLVIRSTDHGKTWSKPIPLKSSGSYYTRGRSRILQLPDGGLLWQSYDMNRGSSLLDATIHRSDDDGKSWRILSVIRRRKPKGDRFNAKDLVVSGDADKFLKLGKPDNKWIDTDEGDLGRLSSGRLVLVVRPDGGTMVSDDNGVTWRQVSRVGPRYVYAPHMVVLSDDTLVLTAGGSGGQSVFLSTNGGKSWSKPIKVDPAVYGYGKLTRLKDQSILLAYVQKHGAPQRCMLVRFKVNAKRNGVELLPISGRKLTARNLPRRRKQLAQRRRRIVFNNDGDDIGRLGLKAPQEELASKNLKPQVYPMTAKGLLQVRTTQLVGSHVDAIWYYSTWGMKLHHSAGPFARMYACPDTWEGGRSSKNYKALLKATGKDTLEITIDFCRKHGMEVFYANRMNDVHDSFSPGNLYNLRRKHPKWCLSTQDKGRKFNYPDVRSCWSAWNFAIPEVRQYTVQALREVFKTYDIDGVELDFFRHFIYFPETMKFKPVTAEHIGMMNDMMRRIRRAADEEGLRRGRPILLAARCLEDVELSKNTGLDVQTWLKEGLVDMLSVAYSTEHTPPLDKLTALAKRTQTPVYPIMGPLPIAVLPPNNINDIKARFGNLPVWRGQAISLFTQGVGGIQFFNVFDPTVPQWRELGDPKQLLSRDRTYVWDFRPSQRKGRPTFPQMRISRYKKPVKVTLQGCEPIPLYVGEDLSATAKTGKPQKLTLRVRVQGLTAQHGLKLLANGRDLPPPAYKPAIGKTATDTWLHYRVNAKLFRKRNNLFVAKISDATDGTPRIDQLRLDVRY